MMADDEVYDLGDTEVFKSIEIINGGCGYFHDTGVLGCKDFYNNMKKYFKIVDIKKINNYKFTYLNDDWENSYNNYAIFLADGTMLLNYQFVKTVFLGSYGSFYIDINGLKKPNKVGRDIFFFYIGSDGIYPMGSSKASIMKGFGNCSWIDCREAINQCELGYKTINGLSCTARVLETGNMDYTIRVNQNGSGGS